MLIIKTLVLVILIQIRKKKMEVFSKIIKLVGLIFKAVGVILGAFIKGFKEAFNKKHG